MNKEKWLKKFQDYCNSEKIQKENELKGTNACGYWFACDYCTCYDCSIALDLYCNDKKIQINYEDTSIEYIDKILRSNGEINE